MSDSTTTFALPDPRSFEGDPYEVAERATQQCASTVELLVQRVEEAALMARNAQLSRNLEETPDDARAAEWLDSIYKEKYDTVIAQLVDAQKILVILTRAAGYNPKAR